MSDVVSVFFVEGVVADALESRSPEYQTVFEGEAEAFEEERVLESGKVFEVCGAAQGLVEVAHAEGEVFAELVDG